MNASEWVLEMSRVLVAGGLAIFLGGTFLAVVVAMKLFGALSSRAQAGEIFGEILHVLDRAKFIAAGAMLIGVLLEVQTLGSSIGTRHILRDALLFVLVAVHVYVVMVVQPKMRYFREKIVDLDAAPTNDPWRLKFQSAHRKSERVTAGGFLLALAALVIG